jgi:5-carboxymethyl-2-hydroxymuconate isomerase
MLGQPLLVCVPVLLSVVFRVVYAAAMFGSFTAGRRALMFSLWRLGRASVPVDHVVTCLCFKVRRPSVGAAACSVIACSRLLFVTWGLLSLLNG